MTKSLRLKSLVFAVALIAAVGLLWCWFHLGGSAGGIIHLNYSQLSRRRMESRQWPKNALFIRAKVIRVSSPPFQQSLLGENCLSVFAVPHQKALPTNWAVGTIKLYHGGEGVLSQRKIDAMQLGKTLTFVFSRRGRILGIVWPRR